MDDSVRKIARPATSRSLREAVRQARVEEAEKLDRSADRRDSEIARLELLKAELEPLFAEVPAGDDRFCLTLVPSRPARLWIDLFTYAAIDDQSGGYLFIRNSEGGRRTLFSSPSQSDMADRIMDHMAREIVRRERQEQALVEPAPAPAAVTHKDLLDIEPERPGLGPRWIVWGFAIGLLTGALGVFAATWLGSVPAP
jgi:hypothetical protein